MAIAAHFKHIPKTGTLEEGPENGIARAIRRRLSLETHGAIGSGKSHPVRILNISETGLLLEIGKTSLADISKTVCEGEAIEIELPEAGATLGRVVWASGNLMGCTFAEKLGAATLSAVRLRGLPAEDAPTGATRPRMDEDALAPEAPAPLDGETLGERLQRLRKLRGMTQAELAARLKVSKPTVWAWEQGRARPIDERLSAIAHVLETTLEDLRPSRSVPGLAELVSRAREQIALVVGTSPEKVRIMIDL